MQPRPAVGCDEAGKACTVSVCRPGENALHHAHRLARCMEGCIAKEGQQKYQEFVGLRLPQNASSEQASLLTQQHEHQYLTVSVIGLVTYALGETFK